MVINEFGELGVDNDLVVDADEEVFEMNNGCICCTVRGDLIRIVGGLMKRRGKFDGIIIETTGLANPAPVAQTFFVDDGVRARTRLDAIVTVVDAKNLPARLADSAEAEEQIAFADVIVLNKTDLVSADELEAVEARIRTDQPVRPASIAPRGPRCRSATCWTRARSTCSACWSASPSSSRSTSTSHNEDVGSMSFEVSRPIDPEKFNAWISALLAEKGQDLLRTKGILAYPNEDRRFAFQAVHMIADGDFIGPWPEGAERRSKLVFIGRNLNRPQLRRGFEACQVAG